MEAIEIVNVALLVGAVIVLVGIVSSFVATRFGVPLLVVFLLIGMLAGEDGPGGIAFENYPLTYLIGSLALAVILFDGGLRTRVSQDLRRRRVPAAMLATVGVVISALIAGAAASYALDWQWLEGFLLGAVISSTDAAAVFFLLRTGGLRLRQKVSSTLELESATNDPTAVIITLIATNALIAGSAGFAWTVPLMLVLQVGLGTVFGLAGGYAISWAINRLSLPSGLYPLLVVASAVALYALTAVLGGSGFLAVFLGGLVVGNRPTRAFADISSFHDVATWLCQMIMFIVLGMLVTPSELVDYIVPGLAIGFALMFIARPVAVWICLVWFGYSRREINFVSWVGLRGAVSIFLAAIPTLARIEHAEAYFNLAFIIVLLSLIVQGSTLRLAARRLGLGTPSRVEAPKSVELDLPGQLALELIGFHVVAGSPILAGSRPPDWARLTLVIRDGQVLESADSGSLRDGDFVYFLAPPRRAHDLATLFAMRESRTDS
jgi:cell volume regulation protein A